MSKHHGFGGSLKVGSEAVGELQNWNLDVQATVSSGYAMGEDWESSKSTVKKWSGSAECYFDPADTGQISLGAGDRVELHFYPDGETSGDHYRSGFANVTGTPITASKENYVSITFNFTGDGALSEGTVS